MNALVKTIDITGAGGGGSSKGGAQEAKNTLRSKAKARMVELVSEGPIVGLVAGAKSIYMNETPIQANNGAFNYKDVDWEQRTGLPDQAELRGMPGVESYVAVGVEVTKNNGPVVRTINAPNADYVRVIVNIPALYERKKDGAVVATTLKYRIEYRTFNGTWVLAEQVDIKKEKCTAPYQRAHKVELPSTGHPWDVRIVRETDDTNNDKLQNKLFWESYFTGTEGRFTYPNSALVYLKVNAEKLGSSVPSRLYHVKGLKVDVPTNYDPETRAYTGSWNGTFKTAWTNNPAWIYRDLVVNDRYGLGDFVTSAQIDKWGLYQIARYCDELVPTGFKTAAGVMTTEPRFTFNGVINTRDDAFRVLAMITSAFRGMTYWSLGQVFAVADMPSDPVKLVTPANVIGGEFSYSGTGLKARHSVALIQWNDPRDLYKPAIEVVIDNDLLKRFGWREKSVTAAGCTSRGQAHRLGKWILDSEEHETETVEYTASWDHIDIKPGDIIAVADPKKASARIGGRIAAVSGLQLTLDNTFTPQAGETYNLMVALPTGTVETRAVSTFAVVDGKTRVTVASAFSSVPAIGAMWVVTGTSTKPRHYRVLAINEVDKHLFRITALFFDPTKFQRVEQSLAFDELAYQPLENGINAPTNLTVTEQVYVERGVDKRRLTFGWTPGQDFMAVGYDVEVLTPAQGTLTFSRVTATFIDIDEVEPGEHVFSVYAVNAAGARSPEATLTYTVTELTYTDTPQNFDADPVQITGDNGKKKDAVQFFWTPPDDDKITKIIFQIRRVTSDGSGKIFEDSTDATEGDGGVLATFTTTKGMGTKGSHEARASWLRRSDRRARTWTAWTPIVMEGDSADEGDTTPPAIPTGLTLTQTRTVTKGKQEIFTITAAWTANTEADLIGYRIAVRKGTNNWKSYDVGLEPEFEIDVKPDNTYSFKVRARDANGNNSDYSSSVSISVGDDVTSPSSPTNVVAIARNKAVTLKWDNPPDADFDRVTIFQSTTNNSATATKVGKTSAEAFTVTGLNNGTLYYFWLRAQDKTGNLAPLTSVVSATPVKVKEEDLDETAPGVPSNLALTSNSALASDGTVVTMMAASWTAGSSASSYDVEITETAPSARPAYIVVSVGTAMEWQVRVGSTYSVRVRSANKLGAKSAWTAAVSYTAAGDTVAPGTPSGVSATGLFKSIVVQWTLGTEFDLTGYELFVSTTNSAPSAGTAATLAVGKQSSAVVENLAPGAQRFIWVRAVDASGNKSAWSAGVSATTLFVAGGELAVGFLAAHEAVVGTAFIEDAYIVALNGNKITANSITASKLEIGQRGITTAGLQFEGNAPSTNSVSWTAGSITYIADNGTPTTVSVSAGNAAWSSGTLYVYWVVGSGTLAASATTATAFQSGRIVLAAYRGGNDLVTEYGRTVIEGGLIKTGTLVADRIVAGSITTDRLEANAVTLHAAAYSSGSSTDPTENNGYAVVQSINITRTLGTNLLITSQWQATEQGGVNDGSRQRPFRIRRSGTTIHSRDLTIPVIKEANNDFRVHGLMGASFIETDETVSGSFSYTVEFRHVNKSVFDPSTGGTVQVSQPVNQRYVSLTEFKR